MYTRNTVQNNPKLYQPLEGPQPYQQPKNYLNYINFQPPSLQKSSHKQPQRDPNQIGMYNINMSQHSQPRSETPKNTSAINRNAYLNTPVEPRRQPPKQILSKNSSNKEPFVSQQSQEIVRNKTQSLKNSTKTNPQDFNRISSELVQSGNKPSNYLPDYKSELGPPNYSQTVDLGAICRHQQSNYPTNPSPQQEELKQKLNYLEVIELSLREFEKTRLPKDLKQLNEDNRLLMLKVFEEINKLKEEKCRKTITDCASESDNYSEDAYSTEERSDGRNNSLKIKTQKKRFAEGLSRSREKEKEKQRQFDKQMRLNQTLRQQYQQELRKANQKQPSQLEKLIASIHNLQRQIQSLNSMNNEVASKLTHLPFYQQWKIMCEEAEGAKKTRVRIREQLIKRKQKLKDLQKGQNKNLIKSEEESANQYEQDQRPKQGSISKNKIPVMTTLKIPPSPAQMNRPQGYSIQNSDSSSKMIKSQNRPKSINRISPNY